MFATEVDIPKREQKWTKEVVKENIKERNEKGNSLRYKDACKDQLNLVAAAQRLFGDWRTAIRESGIDYDQHYAERFGRQIPKPRGYWTKEKIKEEMLKRKKEGKSLKYIHVKNENSRMAGTAYQLFGKWDELIEYIEEQPKEKPNL